MYNNDKERLMVLFAEFCNVYAENYVNSIIKELINKFPLNDSKNY